MATPFSVTANFNLPGTPGLPDQAIPINFLSQYDKKAEFEYSFSSSGTQTIDLGSIVAPGAKMLIFLQDSVSGATTVLVTINSADTPLEVSPGGGIVWFNPSPSTGLTALEFEYTASGRVRVWLLG